MFPVGDPIVISLCRIKRRVPQGVAIDPERQQIVLRLIECPSLGNISGVDDEIRLRMQRTQQVGQRTLVPGFRLSTVSKDNERKRTPHVGRMRGEVVRLVAGRQPGLAGSDPVVIPRVRFQARDLDEMHPLRFARLNHMSQFTGESIFHTARLVIVDHPRDAHRVTGPLLQVGMP